MKQEKFEKLMKQVVTGVLSGLLGVSSSALAVTPNCGDVIGPGGVVTFDSDLECGKNHDPALTFIGPINVNMAGFTLKCKGNPRADIGILLEGTRVLLHDGQVRRCGNNDDLADGAGIVAAGDGKHRIDRMEVRNSHDEGVLLESDGNIVKSTESYNHLNDGFDIKSDQNDLANNNAHDNGSDGFEVDPGNRNKLTNNDASNNYSDGIDIDEGDQNKVVGNTAMDNGDAGIEVNNGDDNKINSNTASNNDGEGIDVQDDATNTETKSNTAEGNGDVDLEDDTADCGTNNWLFNVFLTAKVAGGPNPGLAGCIE